MRAFVPTPPKANNGTAAAISSTAPAIAANATRRGAFWAKWTWPRARWRALARRPWQGGEPEGRRFLNWTEADIVEALTSGFTPGGDVLGGMTAVVRNLAELPESDRQAIAVYLKACPRLGPAPAKP